MTTATQVIQDRAQKLFTEGKAPSIEAARNAARTADPELSHREWAETTKHLDKARPVVDDVDDDVDNKSKGRVQVSPRAFAQRVIDSLMRHDLDLEQAIASTVRELAAETR